MLFLILTCIQAVKANNSGNDKSSYVVIRTGNNTLLQLFQLIQQQTPYSFAYDENEVNLSQKFALMPGKRLLSSLLDSISLLAGIEFTQKNNTFLVNQVMVKSKHLSGKKIALINGVVQDGDGKPVAGATVSIKGTKTAVITDDSGNFSLNASDSAILVISYTGYTSSEVAVNGRSVIKVSIGALNKSMNEVIVIGYQSQKRSDITGAVSIINVPEVSKLPVGFADHALQGKAAGVRITQATGQPGDGIAMRIRGVGTINNNDPLYIIDGVPTKDGINFLSSNDIASITVLKDAASAAIYGARSANGVVVITTRGGKTGKPQISYSAYMGIQTHGALTKMCNNQEYVTLFNEAVVNDNANITNPVLKRSPIPDSLATTNTDWLGSIFRNAPIQSHELSVSGGTDKMQYLISGNIFKQDGIILNSYYNRYSLRTKLNMELSDRINMGININLSYSGKNSVGSSGDGYGGNGGSVVRYALFRTPLIPIYNPDGSYSDLPQYPGFFGDGYNPVALAVYADNKEKQFRVFGDVFAEYKIAKNLKFKTDAGADVFVTEDKTFDRNYGTNLRVNSPSLLTENNITSENFVWNNTLRYNKTFNQLHNVSVLAGTEAISNSTLYQGASDRNFPTQIPSLLYLGNGLNILSRSVSESEQQWALFSLFGNVNYNYHSRYFLSLNVRRDGSSRFGPNYRYGNFYSGSAAWSLLNETWFRDLFANLSQLKLRASFGQLGNQDIGNYPWASVVKPNYNYVFGASPTSNAGYTISDRGNPNVKWESSTQADAGIDLGILHDRLSMSVDYFIKTTSNMLVNLPLPLIGGSAASPFVNNGSVQNKGLEVELNYRSKVGGIKYSVNANFATLQNKVLSLANGTPIPGGRIDNGIFATLTTVGHPIGSFYMYQMEGIFQNQADIFKHAYQGQGIQPGDVKFKDQNGDGIIDQKDRTYLGSALPKFTYGLTANAEYSNFDVSFFFQGSYGNKLYLQVNQDIEGFYRPFNLTQRVYDERWHGEESSNIMPRVSWLGSTNNKTPSSRFLEDASYVRLKNVQLGYTIPKKITDKTHIKGLRIYLTGQNLITITKYTGLDPEMHVSNNVNAETNKGDVAAGIDWGTYPSARSYVLGVNLNF